MSSESSESSSLKKADLKEALNYNQSLIQQNWHIGLQF